MMTETYNHTEDKQQVVKDILSGDTPIATTNKIVLKQLEGDENPFKGKTIEQIEKLRRALKIELLPHGICTHHQCVVNPVNKTELVLAVVIS